MKITNSHETPSWHPIFADGEVVVKGRQLRVKWRCQWSEDSSPARGLSAQELFHLHRNHLLSQRWALSPAGASPAAPRAWWPVLPATPPFSAALRSWAPRSKLCPPNLLSYCSGRFERVVLRCAASVTREHPSAPNVSLLHARAQLRWNLLFLPETRSGNPGGVGGEAGGWGKWRPGRVVARTSVGVRADGALARVREGAVGPSEWQSLRGSPAGGQRLKW